MARIIKFPAQAQRLEIRIEVNDHEENLYSCFWIEYDKYPDRNGWLIWIHANSLDKVPVLLKRAQNYHKMGKEVRRAAL